MGLMIREAMEGGRKGYTGKWDKGEEAGYYHTPLQKFWAGHAALALREQELPHWRFQRFGNGERSSPGGVYHLFCYCLPNLVKRSEASMLVVHIPIRMITSVEQVVL